MFKPLKNSRGVTLVELLAVLVLLSMIILMVNGIHLYGQKQFIRQNEQVHNQENVQYAVKYITKEIRKHGKFEISDDEKVLTITGENQVNDKYWHENNSIYKNNDFLVGGISQLKFEEIGSNGMELLIESVGGSKDKPEKVITQIYSREGR